MGAPTKVRSGIDVARGKRIWFADCCIGAVVRHGSLVAHGWATWKPTHAEAIAAALAHLATHGRQP